MKTTISLGLFLLFNPIQFLAQSPEINETTVLAVGPIDDFTLLFVQVFFGSESLPTEDLSLSDGEDQVWDMDEIDTVPPAAEISKFVFDCEFLPEPELFVGCGRVQGQSVGSTIQYNQILKFESPDLIELGYTNSSTGENQMGICTDSRLIYTFPLSYGSTFSSQFSCSPDTLSSGFQGSEEGERNCEVDAWGTIHLPDITFENILRLKIVESGTMKSYFNGILLVENSFVRTSYEFVDGDYPFPIAVFTKTEIDQNPPNYSAEYITEGFLNDVNHVEEIQSVINVYPNPISSNSFTLKYTDLSDPILNCMLYGVDGRLIYQNHKKINIGTGEVGMEIPSIAAGLYILKVLSADRTHLIKIQIS